MIFATMPSPIDFMSLFSARHTRRATPSPSVGVHESSDAYIVSLTAPGVLTADLSVSVHEDVLKFGVTTRAADATMTIPVDGFAGPRTAKALQSFLKQQGVSRGGPVDGRFGPRTVEALQEFLLQRGYAVGPIDGVFGPRTSEATQQWCQDVDLCHGAAPVDGWFGPRSIATLQATLNALGVPASYDSDTFRRIQLPSDADLDSDAVHASHADGILTVSVPKRAPRQRKLSIGAAQHVHTPNPEKEAARAKGTEEDLGARNTPAAEAPSERTKKEEKTPDAEDKSGPSDAAVGSISKEGGWEMLSPAEQALSRLAELGVDAEMAAYLVEIHSADLDACAQDAERLKAFGAQLNDLAEMGFADRTTNLKALLKHDGQLKPVVKALVHVE